MHEQELPPDPQLMESLRAVGYSMGTAIADIIDNSLAADSTRVEIRFAAEPSPYVAIADNGTGMTREQTKQAMCLAGRSARDTRSMTDLGRFGLGLKTASLSQCRRLTVLSKRGSLISAFRWDLDHLHATGRWALLELDSDEARLCSGFELIAKSDAGTLVLWEGLDQLPSGPALGRVLDEQMDLSRRHLSLVFHRFLSGDAGREPVNITINGRALASADPFLLSHRATQHGPVEVLPVETASVTVQPFTLPHVSKLSRADRESAQLSGHLRDSQGFYVYRAKRLVIWGTWFRLVPKQDLAKLARVRVDIPNSLDHLWSLDIKKSTAVPPVAIRDQLRRTVDRIVAPSRAVHLYRGKKLLTDSDMVPLWNVVEDRDAFRYEINREHPALQALASELAPEALKMFDHTLQAIQAAFPVEDAHNRLALDAAPDKQTASDEELLAYAQLLWDAFRAPGRTCEQFVVQFERVEPFAASPAAAAVLKKAAEA